MAPTGLRLLAANLSTMTENRIRIIVLAPQSRRRTISWRMKKFWYRRGINLAWVLIAAGTALLMAYTIVMFPARG